MTTLKKLKNFSHNQTLVNQLFDLTRPSYVDNTAVLEREINHCKEIYLLYQDTETLVAFFMVNFESLENIDTYYLGLSGCHNDYKGFGYAKYLYNSFFIDCKLKEIELDTKIVCWWTTATPIPFQWFNKNIENCEPTLEGSVSDNGFKLFTKIAEQKYSHLKIDPAIPFILKGVAEKTNYSENEKDKLNKVNEQLNIKAFEKFPIDERKGDRYLMIGYAPQLDILKQRVDNSCP